ncbi:hypothetical protein [Burkholderia pseudomallei]|uniref:hypothetical protein n=1 Tax=Burkholderia pseudomallei TaxID=28450 RepID=UPI001F2C9ABB|nr:hypothetical protein [Burkholderia pseudomallei]
MAILGFGATVAFGLTALSSSAPFFKRIASNVTGRKIRIVVLDRVGQGIVDAAARKAAIAAGQEAAAVAAERAGAMVVGRVLLFYGQLGNSGRRYSYSSRDLGAKQ